VIFAYCGIRIGAITELSWDVDCRHISINMEKRSTSDPQVFLFDEATSNLDATAPPRPGTSVPG
jgi:hypothetical protein